MAKKYWIIQDNIYEEENYKHLIDTLDRFGVMYSVHKAVPFIGVIDPEPTIPEGMEVIVMGSYSLARHAKNRGWKPGAFTENLDFEIQRQHWGNHMLNADAEIYPFGEIPFQEKPFFIRPVLDTKTYTGLVVDWGQYTQWRDGMRRVPECNDPVNDPLSVSVHTLADPTMVCRKKEIYNETRTWIVNGSPKAKDQRGMVMRIGHRIVTCSGYKVGTIKRYTKPEEVDQRILEFADARMSEWSPNDAYVAYVMDVADTPDGLKIVEINNLNSAGWYRADMQKLVMALEEMS